jgi:hypothetical protein
VGSAAFAWHEVAIAVGPSNVTWTVDGTLIASVPSSDDTVNTGNNIFFGHSDTNATSSADPNDIHLLFTLIDVSVMSAAAPIPEPSTYALMLAGLGIVGFVANRRRKREIGAA